MELPKHILDALDGRIFRIILFPTEDCNFSCLYCYENHKPLYMSNEVVAGVKALIEKRCAGGIKNLVVSWFGGEPLLAKNIVYDIAEHCIKLSEKYGFVLTSDITTNAYLLKESIFRDLVKMGITAYQITLDGQKDFHDNVRFLKNSGRGTFDIIYKNLLAMQKTELDFNVALRVHYNKDSLNLLPDFVNKLDCQFGDDRRFKLHLRGISQLGEKKHKFESFTQNEESTIEKNIYSNIKMKQFLVKSEKAPTVCYASKLNSFAIRANGRINKCTVMLDNPGNDIGLLSKTGELEIDDKKHINWLNGIKKNDRLVMECPAFSQSHIFIKNRYSNATTT